jgi:hypothetical protein
MSERNSCLVHYICVTYQGGLPVSERQWAEPDVTHAVDHMLKLVSDRDYARELGERASRDIRANLATVLSAHVYWSYQ